LSAKESIRSAARRNRLINSAVKASLLFLFLSIALLVIAGLTLADHLTSLTIVFAVLGALVQTSVLGLIYEIWLRNEVEDATLEKMGTAQDVRSHGLVTMSSDGDIPWTEVLDTASDLCVATNDPQGLLGRVHDRILARAAVRRLEKFVIAVPENSWDAAEPWLKELERRWQEAAPTASMFAIRLKPAAAYEFVATNSRSIIILPPICESPKTGSARMLEFRAADHDGIGWWLNQQLVEIMKLQPILGYSPPIKSRKKVQVATEEDPQTPDEEVS
jgi:hypothetical protein